MSDLHTQYLQAMGIDCWKEKASPVLSEVSTMDWDNLEKTVSVCALCGLEKTRTQTVFGVGNHPTDLLVIGEAPGANEDKQGEPFVGRAGQLLNAMLHAIKLSRETVYIANILKCRPPNNRDPLPFEVACCTPYLKRQIELLKPKLIVAVGRIAAQFLLDTKETLGKIRGKMHAYQGIPLLITYHPAYLLRSPREKAKAYEDFMKIRQALD